MTTDREALYQQAYQAYVPPTDHRAGIRAVVDLVLDAHPAERPGWEVLREARTILESDGREGVYAWISVTADRLEAEHRAAQEKAAAEAAREKMIEQAAQVVESMLPDVGRRQMAARAAVESLADRGLLAAPETTDGGEA